MTNRFRNVSMVLLLAGFLVALAPPVGVCGQAAKGSVQALFVGIPADLQTRLRSNSVRRDRLNDWLSENVNGKGKTVRLELPVYVSARRDADKTYTVQFTSRSLRGGEPALTIEFLGDTWAVVVRDGGKRFSEGDFTFIGVSAADAEKLVELKKVDLQGKVKQAYVGSGGISLTLEEVSVNGKKWTPRPASPLKGKGKSKGGAS